MNATHRWSRAHILRAVSMVVSLAPMLPSLRLAAQAPAAFVHGLASNASTWGSTPQELASQFNIQTRAPSLSAFSFYGSQAAQLNSWLPAQFSVPLTNLIAIGHSNGGIVSREANRQFQPMQGVITIGTPHDGAFAAQRLRQGYITDYFQDMAAQATAPLYYYGTNYYSDACFSVCYLLWNGINNLYQGVAYALDASGFLIAAGATDGTVLEEMVPGSSFLASLNGSVNLAREASAIPRRIAVTSMADPSLTSLFVGLFPNSANSLTNWQFRSANVYLLYYEFYADYNDWNDMYAWDKRAHAFLWWNGAMALANIDYHWCNLIGGFNFGLNRCESDGIVATTAQVWPGNTRTYEIVNGPGHLQETTSTLVKDKLIRALLENGFTF